MKGGILASRDRCNLLFRSFFGDMQRTASFLQDSPASGSSSKADARRETLLLADL